jgi:hypothetical protein
MLPWNRPQAHADFALEAATLLDQVRAAIKNNGGIPSGKEFEKREIWNGSWRQSKLPPGIHKQTLVGSSAEDAKCHYCEQSRRWKRELNVEHYRPKGGVTRWDGDPSLESDVPPKEIHVDTGYWWAGFSWDNYLLACAACNQEFKRNLFPVIEEPRPAVREGVEQSETPLLLDPGSNFEVREHFEWSDLGVMGAVSPQGRATIITCGLNRKDLRRHRGAVAKDVMEALEVLRFAQALRDRKGMFAARDRLAELGKRQSEFTSMVRWLFEKYTKREWTTFPGFPA